MTTKEKIFETINEIPEEKHVELLSVVEKFKINNSPAKSKGKWSRFAGILTDEQADAMLAVIEETCERIE